MDILVLVILIVSAMFLFGMAVTEERKAKKERKYKLEIIEDIREELNNIKIVVFDINDTFRNNYKF